MPRMAGHGVRRDVLHHDSTEPAGYILNRSGKLGNVQLQGKPNYTTAVFCNFNKYLRTVEKRLKQPKQE